jgi:hypothetical protein
MSDILAQFDDCETFTSSAEISYFVGYNIT